MPFVPSVRPVRKRSTPPSGKKEHKTWRIGRDHPASPSCRILLPCTLTSNRGTTPTPLAGTAPTSWACSTRIRLRTAASAPLSGQCRRTVAAPLSVLRVRPMNAARQPQAARDQRYRPLSPRRPLPGHPDGLGQSALASPQARAPQRRQQRDQFAHCSFVLCLRQRAGRHRRDTR